MTPSQINWPDRLNALLAEADAAAAAGDLPRVLAIVEQLRAFIADSPATVPGAGVPGVDHLDATARERAEQLLRGALAAPLDDLASRSDAHDQLAGQLVGVAGGAQKHAADLRLDPIRRAVPIAEAVLALLRDAVGSDPESRASRAVIVAERLLALWREQLR